jgi:Fur family peroxide stress response transcriptional regulator
MDVDMRNGNNDVMLKELGLKMTPQRRAILKFLDGNKTHPSAEGIYKELLRQYPSMSFATVYNTASRLVDAGKVQELCIDPSKKRFDPDVTFHHHFLCSVCETIFDIANDAFLNLNPLAIKNLDGHQVDAIRLNLRGICRDCRTKQQVEQ